MKKGWKVELVSEVFEVRPPKKEAREKLNDNDLVTFLPMEDLDVMAKEIVAKKEKKLKDVTGSYTYFADNDVLLAKITPCFENGKLGIARNLKNGIGFGSSEYIVFRSKGKIIPEYLFYYLARDEFRKEGEKAMTGAAGQKRVPPSFVAGLEIAYPPLPEQERIVALLDETFAGLAQVHENAERNLVNAREVFELVAREIFENRGDDWNVNKIQEVCELKSGTTISTSLEREKGDVLYVKVGDMNLPENLVEIHTSSRFVKSNEINQNQIIPEGAIIFPKRGGAIATNKKRKIIKPTIVDLNTMAIIPSEKIDKDFLYHWFQLFDLKTISNGANVPQINHYSFDDIYIYYPKSLKEQCAIVERLDALAAETSRLEGVYQSKLDAVEELRKSVLGKAFAGGL